MIYVIVSTQKGVLLMVPGAFKRYGDAEDYIDAHLNKDNVTIVALDLYDD